MALSLAGTGQRAGSQESLKTKAPPRPTSSSSAPSSSRISTSSLLTDSAPSFSSSSSSSSHGNKSSHQFWQGAVKRVPNAWLPDPDSWSFDDLIGDKSTLDAAVVSAYCLEPEWVASHFPDETPLLLVMQGPDNGRGELGLCKLKPNSDNRFVADKQPLSYAGILVIVGSPLACWSCRLLPFFLLAI
ncbi:hypothetical protein JCM11251_007178 [Rhodosporidiobolus azoricus]